MIKRSFLKILILSFLTTYSIFAYSLSQLKTIQSMQEIEKYIDKETLVLFDLDHTIFEAKNYGYGHVNWFFDQVEAGKEQGLEEAFLISQLYPHWAYSQEISEVKPVEPLTPALIKKLQANQIKVLGLTSRQVSVAEISVRQLASIDVDFATAAPSHPIPMEFKAPALMYKGVIFCSDFNDKGPVLLAYLNRMKFSPRKIVFIDDSLRNLHSVNDTFATQPIEIISLYYPLVAKRSKTQWDPHVAQQGYYLHALKHPDLIPFFIEKENKTKGQDELIKHNLEITMPYEFEILGKTFIGLPNVFSPKVFGSDGHFAAALPLRPQINLLEIGSATGYFAVHAALKGAHVVAVDISPEAVKNTQINAKRYSVEEKVDARISDIFSAIKPNEKFDMIYWDIPFNHTKKDKLNLLEQSVYDPEHRLLTRFLNQAGQYLTAKGKVYLGYSPTHGNSDYLYALAKYEGWQIRIIHESGNPETMQIVLYELKK